MAKFKTKGTIAKIGAANPPTTTIVAMGDVTLNLGDRDALVQVTTHDSSTGIHEFLDQGFAAPPSFSGEIMYDPADTVHEVIRAAHAAGTSLYLKVTLPDTGAADILFPGRVKSLSIPLPVMGKLVMSFEFEGTGAYTFTA